MDVVHKIASCGCSVMIVAAVVGYVVHACSSSTVAVREEPKQSKSPNPNSVRHKAIPPQPKKNWSMSSSKSDIDDSTGYTIICTATAPVSKRDVIKGVPLFVIRYMEGRTSAHVSYPFFISSHEIPVTVRFGSNDAVTDDWNVSTSNDAVFMPYSFSEILDALDHSDKMVVRLTPFGESPVTSTFNVSGFRSVVPPDVVSLLKSGDSE